MKSCGDCRHHNELDSVPGNFCSCFNIVIGDDYAKVCKHHNPKDDGEE